MRFSRHSRTTSSEQSAPSTRLTRPTGPVRPTLRALAVTSLIAGAALIAAVSAPADATPSITATGTDNYLVPATASPLATTAQGSPYGVAVSPDSKVVYVAEQQANKVTALDVATDSEVDISLTGTGPEAVVVSPNGQYVYVADTTSSRVDEIQTSTDTVVAHYDTASATPVGLALSPDGSKLFIAEQGSGGVVEELTAPALTLVGSVTGFPTVPNAIVTAPNGAKEWVVGGAGGADGWVQPVTVSSLTLGSETDLGFDTDPFAAAISPDGATLYVANNESKTIQPIATATGVAGATEGLDGNSPIAIAVSPNGKQLWVSFIEDALYGFDTSDLSGAPAEYTGYVTTGYGIAASPDGSHVYAGNYSDDSLSILNPLHVTVSGPGQITPGTATTMFQLSVTDGNTPVGDYSGDNAEIVILDSKDDLVTSAAGTLDPTTGATTISVPTSSVPLGSYSVEAAVGDTTDNALSYALADPFVVGALASTGTDAATPLILGAVLILAGGFALALTRRRNRSQASRT